MSAGADHGPDIRVVTVAVGFVGLGRMGRPMALRLAGVPDDVTLSVYDVRPGPVADLVAAGARGTDDLTTLVRSVDLLCVMVRDEAQVRSVVADVLAVARMGLTVAVLSDVAPGTPAELAAQAAARGVLLVDAPVTGGPAQAADGTLTVSVGGSDAAFTVCRGPLEVLGARVVHTGSVGTATQERAQA